MSVLVGILGIAFILGGAILVHEFGHFVMAKIFGVGVEVFSIGFGKKILKIKRGDTTYALSVIPLGGYVQLKGVLPPEEQKEQGEKEAKEEAEEKKLVAASLYEDQRALRGRSLPTKIAIFVSGVTMNFLTAMFVLALLVFIGFEQSAPFPAKIGLVESPVLGTRYGLRADDEILSLNGKRVTTWDDVGEQVAPLYRRGDAGNVEMEVRRGDAVSTLTMPLYLGDGKTSPVFGLLQPYIPAYAGAIVPNKPAEKAGLQEGDIILSINGVDTPTWWAMVEFIRNNPGKQMVFGVKRRGEILRLRITPQPSAENPKIGEIGIVMGNPQKELVKKGVIGSLGFGFDKSIDISLLIIYATYDIYKRMNLRMAQESVGGPVAIAIISYNAAKRSFESLLQFFAGFNIMLAILNLVPIPLMDGGHILISVIEAIARRPIPPKVLVKVYMVVLVLLIALALLVTYNDILMNVWRIRWIWR
jgi:regulator of sigma E protease